MNKAQNISGVDSVRGGSMWLPEGVHTAGCEFSKSYEEYDPWTVQYVEALEIASAAIVNFARDAA